MGRGTKESGDQVRAFARHLGCSLPTARKYRAAQSPEWEEWLHAKHPSGAGEIGKPAGNRTEWERAQIAREHAWAVLEKIQRRIESAGDEELPALARALRMQRRTYEDACAHEERAKLKAGQLIPRRLLEDVESTLISPLNDAFRALKNSVAGRLPQQDRAKFYNAWQASLPGWQRAIAALDDGFERLLRETC